ncbi:MAG TPA: hypothetical protein VF519_15625 [Mycobacteriales bacterium]|jgi:hypothetical protein
MKKTLRLSREELRELTAPELQDVQGGTHPLITDGHHCFGTTLCAGLSLPTACGVLTIDC